MVDINKAIGSKIIGGVNYAGWGYLTRKPRTEQEWEWSVSAMKKFPITLRNLGRYYRGGMRQPV